jgi:hypothetical protein
VDSAFFFPGRQRKDNFIQAVMIVCYGMINFHHHA